MAAVVFGATVTQAGAALPAAPDALPQLWGLEVNGKTLRLLDRALLKRLRTARITLIAAPGGLTASQERQLARLAARWNLSVFQPVRARYAGTLERAELASSACVDMEQARPSTRCGLKADSPVDALLLSREEAADVVVVRVPSARALSQLDDLTESTRMVGVLDLSNRSFSALRWRSSIVAAKRRKLVDLAVRPTGDAKRVALVRLLNELGGLSRGDRKAPSKPGDLVITAATGSSISLSWKPSRDNDGVIGYGLYRNGVHVGTSPEPSATFGALTCAAYLLEVDAVDRAGNRSAKASLVASPAACDAFPPSKPANLVVSDRTASTVTLSWSASTDLVGVTGYLVSVDGTIVSTTTDTATTVLGLACGHSYAFGVEARDAAGNVSARSTLTGATSACSSADTQPPSVPQGMAFSGTTQTSVSLVWNASADNVGVAGYHLYRNGARVASTQSLSHTYSGLTCGTSYAFALEAYDAAGNTSNRAEATGTAATDSCESPPPPPPPPPDDETVATIFVSTSGSDTNACTQAAPCASFDRAYRVAAPGQAVEVGAGTYPSQTIRAVAGRIGPNIVFRPAVGARVILGGLTFGANADPALGPDFITVKRMETTYRTSEPGAGNQRGIFVGPGSTFITLEDIDAGSVATWFADHVTIRGGDYGPCHAVWGSSNICGNSKLDVSTNVTIDGAVFHDYRFDETCFTVSGADCHWECMYVNAGENITIKNSRFYRCAIFDIFTTISGPDAGKLGHRNLTIENNWFAAPWTESLSGGSPARPSALSLAWCQNSSLGYKNVLVRFNSFQANTTLQLDHNPDCVFENIQVIGNVMMWDGCQSRWSFSYNVWTTVWRTGSCSSTDKILGASLPYMNTGTGAEMDYHLLSASAIDDLVPASAGCPASDIDGQRRPAGTRCDAGADER